MNNVKSETEPSFMNSVLPWTTESNKINYEADFTSRPTNHQIKQIKHISTDHFISGSDKKIKVNLRK